MRMITLEDLLLAILLAALLGGVGGGYAGYAEAQHKGDAALAHYKIQVQAQQLQAEQSYRQQLQAAQRRAGDAEIALDDFRRSAAQDKQVLQRRIANVTTLYKTSRAAAPRPLPQCVFTAGFLRDYNAALGLPASAPGAGATTIPPAGAAPGADAELLDSGLTQADLLAHAGDYGEYCQGLAHQVNGLLNVLEAR